MQEYMREATDKDIAGLIIGFIETDHNGQNRH
jgi:hypothetical protein